MNSYLPIITEHWIEVFTIVGGLILMVATLAKMLSKWNQLPPRRRRYFIGILIMCFSVVVASIILIDIDLKAVQP